ncbi:S-adenosylmethionine decarboxylase [Psychromonas sp. RZ22]|uniref:S-adenosylmethionine decarboxylase n=1 Tax=Psychromonas algarum TaxID=2555643 RepID=UPI001067E523|nr:S-adenosylmethionine decarboxylase [Psychromonas sp. RZ22]TEW56840.1 S-adenosylmethionine decarboxylase [Psychromonas sp. RZ22]
MFYEGTEKRLLICTNTLNLFSLDESFWQELVVHSGAEILSTISNPKLKAYLLSESSLFVWQDKLLLITCGNTQLVKAALFIQQHLSKQQIKTLIFQRHQALKPELQSSSFQQDALLLEKQFNGKKWHWRDSYQGDLFVFGEITSNSVTTQNIYMLHNLSGELAKQLQVLSPNKEVILESLKLETYFHELSIDHFSFNPKGYSLNAISGEDYITIHLTPEKLSTYLSIETSFSEIQCAEFVYHLEHLFLPEHIKKMHFQVNQQELNITAY